MNDRPTSLAGWRESASQLRIETRAFIDGRYRAAASGRAFGRISPTDGTRLAEIADCDAADVDAAVDAARRAFEDGRWRDLAPNAKKRIMLRFAELMRANLDELALLETLDVGKPIGNSLAVDVPFAADCIQYYAELADKLYDEVAPVGPTDLALLRREPLGVVAAIVPWNYPLIIACWKIGPALLAGNSVVLKPAEQSSLTAIRLAALGAEAGIPDGVLQVVPGFGEKVGQPLALHDDVDMVSFTGSTEVGKLMLRYAGASNMKRVSLECGGKSPHVVLADADLDAAASGIAWGIFYNQGETCHAGSRVIVEASVHDALVEKIVAVQRTQIPIGPALDPAAQMGALIEATHMAKVLDYVESGRREGASLVCGGGRTLRDTGGFYVEPTIFTAARQDMRIVREEIFGPVLAVSRCDGEAEALRLANDTIYGLGAAIWTRDMKAAHRLSAGIKAGTVWVNTFDKSAMATPFGGFKQSGFGRDRSIHAVEKYTDIKTIWTAYS